MGLEKMPGPDPSVVLGSEVVGLAEVLQHTPLAITEAPPSDVTLPPEVAVVEVMLETAAVVTVGVLVLNDTSAP